MTMKFFFADSCDAVDPHYDFTRDIARRDRNRLAEDTFAHEELGLAPYDGILVSRAVLDGARCQSRYTQTQRLHAMTRGVHSLFRLLPCSHANKPGSNRIPIMGDCGAFTYVKQDFPPYDVPDTLAFYQEAGFTYGLSPDHIITEFNCAWDDLRRRPNRIAARADFTSRKAVEFLRACQNRNASFEPIGVVQSWSPRSASAYAIRLVEAGFTYIALGGLAARPTTDVYNTIAEVASRLPPDIRLHILGFNRIDKIDAFQGLPIHSFDSSSPMLKSFKDDRHNYFSPSGNHYLAIRIPSLDESVVRRRIASGELQHDQAVRFEEEAVDALRRYARREVPVDEVLAKLDQHARLFFPGANRLSGYERTLRDRPWEQCACAICARLGFEVILFRGLNRNKRRGYHNLFVFYEKLRRLNSMNCLEVPCIKTRQTSRHTIYSFVVDGKDLPKFAAVSRIGREDAGDLKGYQRPEISEHITEIREYLEREDALLPNSVVLAFNGPVKFVPSQEVDEHTAMGKLQIDVSAEKPAWIVDGQQRAAALRQIKRARFPVSVVAFVSDGVDMERKQFVLVNNTRPLPKNLIYELLPCIGSSVPVRLRKRQMAYRLLAKLNTEPKSPFRNRIATATSGLSPEASIKDLSVLKMIENSFDGGILQPLGSNGPEPLHALCNYWRAVRDLYGSAWDLPPRRSRLTHGVGIVSMGYVMDAVGYALSHGDSIPTYAAFLEELRALGADLPWTTGEWRFSDQHVVPWNELQNTARHVDLLANHLIRRYKRAKAQARSTSEGKLPADVQGTPGV